MTRFKTLLGALVLFAAGSGSALAQSVTDFEVRITITEACEFSSSAPTDVDFGTVARSVNPADAAGALLVDCTVGTPYSIALDAGQNSTAAVASANNRRMVLAGQFVPYGLYRDAGRTQFWGDVAGASGNVLVGAGTGTAQNVPVYGRVPTGSTNVPAGIYVDVVQATLTF